MIFRNADDLSKQDRRKRTIRRILFVVAVIIAFVAGFFLARPVMLLFS